MAARSRVELSTRLRQVAGIVGVAMDGQLVTLNISRGSYYGLDEVAARIWPLLSQPRSVAEVCSLLMEEFDPGKRDLHSDVVAFLNTMVDEGLVEILDETTP